MPIPRNTPRRVKRHFAPDLYADSHDETPQQTPPRYHPDRYAEDGWYADPAWQRTPRNTVEDLPSIYRHIHHTVRVLSAIGLGWFVANFAVLTAADLFARQLTSH